MHDGLLFASLLMYNNIFIEIWIYSLLQALFSLGDVLVIEYDFSASSKRALSIQVEPNPITYSTHREPATQLRVDYSYFVFLGENSKVPQVSVRTYCTW
jgi:hypothetical protein